MADFRAVIAKRLRDARLERGLSQKRLGILAGIDEFVASARINQYEKSRHEPKFTMLSRLANVLEVPVAYFFATDNDLAAMLQKWPRLTSARRRALLKLAAKS